MAARSPILADRQWLDLGTTVGRAVEELRPHASRGGTGLGLAVVRAMVDAHEGRVTVESQEGKGRRSSVIDLVDDALAAGDARVFGGCGRCALRPCGARA